MYYLLRTMIECYRCTYFSLRIVHPAASKFTENETCTYSPDEYLTGESYEVSTLTSFYDIVTRFSLVRISYEPCVGDQRVIILENGSIHTLKYIEIFQRQ